jgi:hypothetical protein
MYKVYLIFSKPVSGPDIETEHGELRDIIISFIQDHEIPHRTNEALFKQLVSEASFDTQAYKNFNQNRFNQLIQQLFYTYDVNSLTELIESINAQNS